MCIRDRIRMSPSIGENDFLVKLKNGQKFLADGDRVKVTVRFCLLYTSRCV